MRVSGEPPFNIRIIMKEPKFKINDEVWIEIYETFGVVVKTFPKKKKKIYPFLTSHNSYDVKFFNKYENKKVTMRFPEVRLAMREHTIRPSNLHSKENGYTA